MIGVHKGDEGKNVGSIRTQGQGLGPEHLRITSGARQLGSRTGIVENNVETLAHPKGNLKKKSAGEFPD